MKPTKYYSSRQEHKIAEELDWSVVSGSGARPHDPGDIISDDWLGECKTHTSECPVFFDIDVWAKINEESFSRHRSPVLFVDNGTQLTRNCWCICRENALDTDEMILVDYPFKIVKHIQFNHETTYEILDSLCRECSSDYDVDKISFKLTWGRDSVLLMPFNTFKEMIDI